MVPNTWSATQVTGTGANPESKADRRGNPEFIFNPGINNTVQPNLILSDRVDLFRLYVEALQGDVSKSFSYNYQN